MTEQRPVNPVPQEAIGDALKGQYRAGLAMLEEAVTLLSDDQWANDGHPNSPWQLAYHVLYFTHLYLQRTNTDFVPWPGHQSGVQHEDGIAGRHDENSDLPLLPAPYSRQKVLEYAAFLEARIDGYVDAMDLASPDSGFPWYQVSKLEHQIINVRHLHHHVAQLADRVRAATGRGVRWVRSS